MQDLRYINRLTGKVEEEKVFGEHALRFLYGQSLWSKLLGRPLCFLIARIPLFSFLFGWWHKRCFTKRKIQPFIQKYQINTSDFLEKVNQFSSFNDFFIRKLKPESRPIVSGKEIAVMPTDGRYLFFENLAQNDGFFVKGEKFNLQSLLQDFELSAKYEKGTMIMSRLCPTDYHRFHFPVTCVPSQTHFIKGSLYSVNPWAIVQDVSIFTKNKRTFCELTSDEFGKVIFMEVGATCVGSIHQTYLPNILQSKGAEKGFFSLGASSLIILFEPGRLILDPDLIEASAKKLEILCLMGQRLGKSS
jgi:phosphatidylserine decarboxylase